jgi:hypothetical protein
MLGQDVGAKTLQPYSGVLVAFPNVSGDHAACGMLQAENAEHDE